MHKAKKSTWMVIAVMIAAALVAPVVAGPKNNYMLNILISYCYFGILAASLNLLIGYTGQMSLGHAAFMAIGGYAYAILNKPWVCIFSLPLLGQWLSPLSAGCLSDWPAPSCPPSFLP